MYYLNKYYLGKKYPTNILSFPVILPLEIKSPLLGDIVLCRQVIEHEIKKNHIPFYTHWAHMVVHGSLHLLGYNHVYEQEAILMKKMEIKIMKRFGYKNIL